MKQLKEPENRDFCDGYGAKIYKTNRLLVILTGFTLAFGLAACPAEAKNPGTSTAAVSALDLTGLVAAPVTGAMPQAVFAEQAQYTGTIVWKQGDAEHTGGFAPSTVYRAALTLNAKNGCAFSYTGRFTYTGAAVTQSGNTGSRLLVTITFPATAALDTPDTTPPAEVSGLSALPGDGAVTLVWTQPSDADFSHIEITFTPAADGITQPLTVNKETNSVIIDGLSNGTQYTFTLRTVDTSGNESAGTQTTAAPEAGILPDTAPPAEVSGLSAAAGDGTPDLGTWTGSGKVTLAWTAPADPDFSHVEITFTPAAGGITQPLTVNRGTNSVIIDGLSNEQEYAFTAQTVDAAGNKSTGTQAAAAPVGLYTPPPLTWPADQKLNLDPPAMSGGGAYDKQRPDNAISRIDKLAALGWPADVGAGVVALWPDNKRGAFTITFDDDHTENYDEMNLWKTTYGIPFTLFVRGLASSVKTGGAANLAKKRR